MDALLTSTPAPNMIVMRCSDASIHPAGNRRRGEGETAGWATQQSTAHTHCTSVQDAGEHSYARFCARQTQFHSPLLRSLCHSGGSIGGGSRSFSARSADQGALRTPRPASVTVSSSTAKTLTSWPASSSLRRWGSCSVGTIFGGLPTSQIGQPLAPAASGGRTRFVLSTSCARADSHEELLTHEVASRRQALLARGGHGPAASRRRGAGTWAPAEPVEPACAHAQHLVPQAAKMNCTKCGTAL